MSFRIGSDTPDRPSDWPTAGIKHWRSFGTADWAHVRGGLLGLLFGTLFPVLLFYGAYRTFSFTAAVLAVLGWTSGTFAWHRLRNGTADVFSATTFGFALVKATAGLASQNPTLYLAWPSLENVIYGAAFFGSALVGRPVLTLYARRLYPLPPAVATSATFRDAFKVVSLVWLVGNLLRGLLRLALLASLPLEWYLVVDTMAGWPINLSLVGFAVWWPLRQLRRAGLMAETVVVDAGELGDTEVLPGTL